MLRNTQDLVNYTISATDGLIGHAKDFYFDDDAWVVRYLVVETGSWLSGRKVLISPISVNQPNWLDHTLSVSISKAQVENSPNIDSDPPVSRQNEELYLGYYGYPRYWGGDGMWGEGLYPFAMMPGYAGYGVDSAEHERDRQDYLKEERIRHRNNDPHLRSCKAVTGYHLEATDGEIGHVAGYLVDEQTWAIRYLIVDTSNWWLGHKVLIAPAWITGVHWPTDTVSVSVTRQSVKDAPVYDPNVEWIRQLDLDLYRHHGRRAYWDGSALPEPRI